MKVKQASLQHRHIFLAGRTLDEEQMTGTVDAVGMGIAGVAALVTNRYHHHPDAFAQAIVKYQSSCL